MSCNCQSLLARYVSWAIFLLLVTGLGIWMCASEWRRAAKAADYSAHAELAKEICGLLAAIPPGQSYPASLKELSFTFPDGGDSSLLDRFEYVSNGANCILRTELVWEGANPQVIVRAFPEIVPD